MLNIWSDKRWDTLNSSPLSTQSNQISRFDLPWNKICDPNPDVRTSALWPLQDMIREILLYPILPTFGSPNKLPPLSSTKGSSSSSIHEAFISKTNSEHINPTSQLQLEKEPLNSLPGVNSRGLLPTPAPQPKQSVHIWCSLIHLSWARGRQTERFSKIKSPGRRPSAVRGGLTRQNYSMKERN